MDRSPTFEQAAAWFRARPFVVDCALAGAVAFFTVLLPAQTYWQYPGRAFVIGLLLTVPLAWRRRAPVPAAVAVTAAGLLEVATVGDLLVASISALFMIYALAAYAPRWASRGGLVLGLFGAAIAALRYFSSGVSDALIPTAGAMAIAVVAAWALGDLRRARLLRIDSLEERARLLEIERDQEMRLAATAERARIARELHDVVAHSLSVVIAQADGGRYAGKADPAAATGALEQIAATGRQALTDMRSLLGVLRDGGGEEYAPQPDVDADPGAGRGRPGQRAGRRPAGRGRAPAAAGRPAAGRLPDRAGVPDQRAQARRAGVAGPGCGCSGARTRSSCRSSTTAAAPRPRWSRPTDPGRVCAACASAPCCTAGGWTPDRAPAAASACTPRSPTVGSDEPRRSAWSWPTTSRWCGPGSGWSSTPSRT